MSYLDDLPTKVIVDSGDTEMPQRQKLKITGATITDDAANAQTLVAVTGGLTAPTGGQEGYVPIANGSGDFAYLAGSSNGHVLTWNSTSGEWESAAPAGGGSLVTTVASGAVSATGVTANRVLTTDGSTAGGAWTTLPLAALDTTGTSAGDVLQIGGGGPVFDVLGIGDISDDAASQHEVPISGGAGSMAMGLIANANVDASAAIAVSKLSAGTDTYVLTTVSGVPTWAAASGGGGGFDEPEQIGKSTSTLTPGVGEEHGYDCSSGGFTATLPASPGDGSELIIFQEEAGSSNNLTIAVQSGEKLNGTTDGTLVVGEPYARITCRSTDDNDWIVTLAADSVGGGGGASELDGLSDVTLTSEGTGDILAHNGTAFVNPDDIAVTDSRITSGAFVGTAVDDGVGVANGDVFFSENASGTPIDLAKLVSNVAYYGDTALSSTYIQGATSFNCYIRRGTTLQHLFNKGYTIRDATSVAGVGYGTTLFSDGDYGLGVHGSGGAETYIAPIGTDDGTLNPSVYRTWADARELAASASFSNSGVVCPIADGDRVTYDLQITAVDGTSGDRWEKRVTGLIRRVGGTVTVETPQDIFTETKDDASWDYQWDTGTSGELTFQIKGDATNATKFWVDGWTRNHN